MRRMYALLAAVALLLAGCTKHQGAESSQKSLAQVVEAEVDLTALFSDRDYDTTFDQHATITLNGSGATSDSNAVKIEGSTVTVTEGGSYLLSGSLENGQIVVNTHKNDKTQLILDGVSVHAEATAPVYVQQADKVFITLRGENKLSNGGSFENQAEENIDSVIFSKEDLTLNGKGTLTVTSPAGHGIVSKDELTFTGGSYQITTADHGIAGKDNICIDGGSYNLATGKDGIHSENKENASLGFVYIKSGDFSVSAEGDGISAGSWLHIENGSYNITTGGGSENGQKEHSDNWGIPGGMGGRPGGKGGFNGNGGMGGRVNNTSLNQNTGESEDSTSIKGLKAGTDLLIEDGSFELNTADDGIHADNNLCVLAGAFAIATGDDGLHAEQILQIKGGTITVTESYEGFEGHHIQVEAGQHSLTTNDDGLNAAGGTDDSGMGGRDQYGGGFGGMSKGDGSITITGGKLYIEASGDGIDANGTLLISGGFTVVCGPTQGDTATLDYDVSATITGGTFLGSGSSMMAQTFSSSEQGVIALNLGGAMEAGTTVKIIGQEGKEIVSYTPELDFIVMIVSTPELVKGERYTVSVGNLSDTFTAN